MDKLAELKPTYIEQILKAKPIDTQKSAPYPICKIVDNSAWALCASVSDKDAAGVSVGDYVVLRFPSEPSNLLDASVAAISPVEVGKVALSIKCSQASPGIYSLRTGGVDIIKHRYKGLKIPKAALINQNGKDGALVRKAALTQFKEAEVLYKGSEYAIIKEDNANPNSILLYDEVITRKR